MNYRTVMECIVICCWSVVTLSAAAFGLYLGFLVVVASVGLCIKPDWARCPPLLATNLSGMTWSGCFVCACKRRF